MRPLKLTMTAFGPYLEKTVIDMAALGESGLYLITGDTGAGKTTIFDAIVYALYGEASGDTRKPSMFRSQGASPSTVTEVILTFLYDGKEYTVKRTPEYMRPKLTGPDKGKLIKQNPSVELLMPDGFTVLTKNKEVDDTIRELLGIDCDQFTQIVMIAQGEFRKILFAPTKTREEIFSTLFKTGVYKQMQESLKERTKVLKDACSEADRAQKQYMEGIVCTSAEWMDPFTKIKKAAIPEEVLEFLQILIADDEKKLETVSATIEETESDLTAATRELDNIRKYHAIKEMLEAETRSFAAESQKEALLSETLENARRDAVGIETLDQAISDLQMELSRHDEIRRLESEQSAFLNDAETQTAAVLLLEKRLESESEKQKNLEAEAQTLKQAGAQKERLLRERADTERAQSVLTDFIRLIGEYRTLSEKFAKAQRSYLAVSDRYTEIKADYEQKSKAFLDAQAGILAENLTERTPCPVCGSLVHPTPAKKPEHAPTEAEWKNAKKQYDRAEAERNESATVCASIRGETEKVRATLDTQCTAIFGNGYDSLTEEQIQRHQSDLRAEYHRLTDAIGTEDRNIQRKDTIERLLPTVTAALETIRTQIGEKRAEMVSLTAKAEEKRSQIRTLSGQLRFPSKKEAETQQQIYETQKTALRLALQNAENAYNENQKQLSAIVARMDTLEHSLPALPEKDLSQAQECVTLLTAKKNRSVREKETIIGRLSPNRKTFENLQKNIAQMKELEQNYSWMKTLSDTANGRLSGKEKVAFETFVQKTYLERILVRANRRLRIMTDDQYELKCRDEADSKGVKSGLELNVIDHYNGTERDVRTLSGGETFKASLALALGLSDEIQASAGGIRLDTMFVDEGFGSLDDSSLEYAMRALSDLTDGGRLVGIISHVGVLKDKIPKQIVVKKEKENGSTVTMSL